MSQMQLDAQVVMKKLQDRIGEAYGTISVLEAQIELLQNKIELLEKVQTNGSADSSKLSTKTVATS